MPSKLSLVHNTHKKHIIYELELSRIAVAVARGAVTVAAAAAIAIAAVPNCPRRFGIRRRIAEQNKRHEEEKKQQFTQHHTIHHSDNIAYTIHIYQESQGIWEDFGRLQTDTKDCSEWNRDEIIRALTLRYTHQCETELLRPADTLFQRAHTIY